MHKTLTISIAVLLLAGSTVLAGLESRRSSQGGAVA